MMTIKLKWRLYEDDIIEYFAPYSYEILNDLFSLENGRYYGRDNWFDSQYIDYEHKPSNNPENIDDFMLSDYICDIHSVVTMHRMLKNTEIFNFGNLNESNQGIVNSINAIATKDIVIQQRLDVFKLHLSLLINGELNSGRGEGEHFVFEYLHLLNELLLNRKIATYEEYFLHSEELRTFCAQNDMTTMIRIILKIDESVLWLYQDNLNNVTEDVVKAVINTINRRKSEIPNAFGREYAQRFRIIRMIMRFLGSYNRMELDNCILCAVSQDYFEREKGEIVDRIITNMQTEQESIFNNFTIMPVGYNKIIELEKFFSGEHAYPKRRKFQKQYGCFGIMEVVGSDKNYYALSCIGDYVGGVHSINKDDKFEELAEKVKKEVLGDGYEWARLSDDTKRYTVIVNCNEDRRKYIQKPICLGDDSLKLSQNKIGSSYGCCERKMQALCNDLVSDKIFYTRWATCERCLPALDAEQGEIRIFALFEKPTKSPTIMSSELSEYEITKSLICQKK